MFLKPKIGLCVIYHPFEDNADKAQEIFENSVQKLISTDKIEIIQAEELIHDVPSALNIGKQFKKAGVDVICVKLATWSSDNPILDMSSECDVPFIFWTYSHISSGSLCGGQQFNMVFKELGKECIFVYKDDENALEKIKTYAIAVELRNQLKKIRVVRIGNRTQGMSEVICDELSVKEILGPRVIDFGLDMFKQLADQFSNEDALGKWEEIKKKIKKISINDDDGVRAIKNYLAIKNLIENGLLSGVTIECYPNYMGEVCLAFSLLADEGIPGACESDVNSLILMYVLMHLSEQPVHNIDPLLLNEEDNSMLGSHCGCGSIELSESKELISIENVRLANKGVCILFPSKPGKVTIANLVGRKGTYRLAAIEGEAVNTTMEFPGNPIRIKLAIMINTFLDIVEELALGHHWIVAYGSYKEQLKYLAALLKIDFFSI